MDDRELDPRAVEIVSRLMQGQDVSPDDRRYIIQLAASTPPVDPNHEALARAAVVAQGGSNNVTLSGTPSPTQSVAANIANGQYAGGATKSSPGADAAAAESRPWVASLFPQGTIGGDLAGALGLPTSPQTHDNLTLFGIGPTQPATLDALAPPPPGDAAPDEPGWWARNSGDLAKPDEPPYHTGNMDPIDLGPQIAGAVDQLPPDFAGYSFSGMSASNVANMMNDQDAAALEALALARQRGGGQTTAFGIQPYVNAAMALAPTGVLGGVGVAGNTAMQGPASPQYQLKAVEDFVNGLNAPGAYVAPSNMLDVTLQRLANTPQEQFAKMTSLGLDPSSDLANPDDQITATNNALTAASQLTMTAQSQKSLEKLLAMTEIQYKQMMLNAGPGPMMSYPAYLQSIGLPQMFGA